MFDGRGWIAVLVAVPFPVDKQDVTRGSDIASSVEMIWCVSEPALEVIGRTKWSAWLGGTAEEFGSCPLALDPLRSFKFDTVCLEEDFFRTLEVAEDDTDQKTSADEASFVPLLDEDCRRAQSVVDAKSLESMSPLEILGVSGSVLGSS